MDGCRLCDVEHPRGAPDCPARRVGRVLGGRYRLDKLLGIGGMGAVYEAAHLELGTRVAVKTIQSRVPPPRETIERFRREARELAALRHPGIVEVYDLGQDDDGVPFMVMELLTGNSVAELLAHGPLPIARAVRIACDALEALAEAHAHSLVHRDLKPANLFVARTRESEAVKILDFGIAKVMGDGGTTALTRSGLMIGSAPYMSPEQTQDSSRIDPRSDLYAMGATLFELLTGQMSVDGATSVEVVVRIAKGEVLRHPRELRPQVPAWLDEIVAKALATAPAARHQSALEMKRALEQGLQGVTLPGAAVPPPSDLPRAGELAAARDASERSRGPQPAAPSALAPTGAAAVVTPPVDDRGPRATVATAPAVPSASAARAAGGPSSPAFLETLPDAPSSRVRQLDTAPEPTGGARLSRPSLVPATTRSRSRRRRLVYATVGAVLVTVTAGATVRLWPRSDPPPTWQPRALPAASTTARGPASPPTPSGPLGLGLARTAASIPGEAVRPDVSAAPDAGGPAPQVGLVAVGEPPRQDPSRAHRRKLSSPRPGPEPSGDADTRTDERAAPRMALPTPLDRDEILMPGNDPGLPRMPPMTEVHRLLWGIQQQVSACAPGLTVVVQFQIAGSTGHARQIRLPEFAGTPAQALCVERQIRRVSFPRFQVLVFSVQHVFGG